MRRTFAALKGRKCRAATSRPRRAAMRHRKPQVGDAGLEVVLEAGDRARQQRAVIGPNALGEVTTDGSRWGLVTGARTRLELRPQVSRDLDGKVAHPMRETTLPRCPRPREPARVPGLPEAAPRCRPRRDR